MSKSNLTVILNGEQVFCDELIRESARLAIQHEADKLTIEALRQQVQDLERYAKEAEEAGAMCNAVQKEAAPMKAELDAERAAYAKLMENGQMVEKTLYERLKDNGKPHFPKSQAFHLCAELQSCALRILRGCVAANGRYFETEYEERLKDLDGVLIECETMGQLINLSFKRKYITGDQCHYWAELVRPVRQKAFNWRKSDGNRAATLREAKTAQELAKMGQMALQMAEALRPQ